MVVCIYYVDLFAAENKSKEINYDFIKNMIVKHQKEHGDLEVAAGISGTNLEKDLGYMLKNNFKFMTYIKARIIAFRLFLAIRKYKNKKIKGR